MSTRPPPPPSPQVAATASAAFLMLLLLLKLGVLFMIEPTHSNSLAHPFASRKPQLYSCHTAAVMGNKKQHIIALLEARWPRREKHAVYHTVARRGTPAPDATPSDEYIPLAPFAPQAVSVRSIRLPRRRSGLIR